MVFFSSTFFPRLVFPLSGLAVCILLFVTGCASKGSVQPPAMPSQVTDILLARYEAWEGIPHRTGGRDRDGIDCSGFMQVVFREAFGVELPRTSREQSLAGQGIAAADMRPGDLVYFAGKGGGHIGVVVSEGRFLHVSASVGVTVSKLDGYWWPRLLRVRRILSSSLVSSSAGS